MGENGNNENGTLGGQKISNGKKNDTTKPSSATIFSLPTGASPYTGLGAVISIRVVVKSFLNEVELNTANSSTNKTIHDKDKDNEAEMVLDEYGDLNSLLVHGENVLQDGSGFRIILERYSIALVRDHIVRLRSLLGGNCPNSVSLDEGGGDGGADDIESSPSKEKETKRGHEGQ